jgi:hypothetical protein
MRRKIGRTFRPVVQLGPPGQGFAHAEIRPFQSNRCKPQMSPDRARVDTAHGLACLVHKRPTSGPLAYHAQGHVQPDDASRDQKIGKHTFRIRHASLSREDTDKTNDQYPAIHLRLRITD